MDKQNRRALMALLVVAFILRAALAIAIPGIAHPDEIYQYQEPAHKILTGLGIITWEWKLHIRSWLIPGLVLPVMAGVRLFSHSPQIYAAVINCLMSAASLPLVWVAYQWGREQGDNEQEQRENGIIVGALAALSYQLVYYSPHLLMDTVATDLLLPTLYACRAYRQNAYRQNAGARALAWGSLLLAFTAYLRPQLAPALLLPAATILWAVYQRQNLRACIAWGLGPLLALGLLDWLTLGLPFQSVWLYIYVNLHQVRGEFGVLPWYWYLGNSLLMWSSAIVPIALFNGVAFKKFRIECLTALLIVTTVSLVGHKESRFILPAQAILLILTGVGITLFRTRRSGIFAHPAPIVTMIAAASLALALPPSFRKIIFSSHTELKAIWQRMTDPQACGIDIAPHRALIVGFPGYTGMRDGITLHSSWIEPASTAIAHSNYLITRLKPTQTKPTPAGFTLQSCAPNAENMQICIYHRPGGCG